MKLNQLFYFQEVNPDGLMLVGFLLFLSLFFFLYFQQVLSPLKLSIYRYEYILVQTCQCFNPAPVSCPHLLIKIIQLTSVVEAVKEELTGAALSHWHDDT